VLLETPLHICKRRSERNSDVSTSGRPVVGIHAQMDLRPVIRFVPVRRELLQKLFACFDFDAVVTENFGQELDLTLESMTGTPRLT
jgi:hypothetical protein